MAASSSYSDSSSELVSSSEELVSVGVGDFPELTPAPSRKFAIRLACLLVPLYLLMVAFSFGARIFLIEVRAGADIPKRESTTWKVCEIGRHASGQ
jgi:hypothetical protein